MSNKVFVLDHDLHNPYSEQDWDEIIERGGPGSGHHGHEGRPGEVGGSLPRFGKATSEPEDYDAYIEEHGMEATLKILKPKFVEAAQEVYDDWIQDEQGHDQVYGTGGICDQIAEKMGWALVGALESVSAVDGGQPGEGHAWIVAYNNKEAYGVDLPAGVYEDGYNYNWTKIEGVTIQPDHIEIFKVDHGDLEYYEGLDEEIYFANRASPWGALLIPSYHSTDTERAKREHEEQRNLDDDYQKTNK